MNKWIDNAAGFLPGYNQDNLEDAGRSLWWRRSFFIRSIGLLDLWQWVVGLQQERWCKLFVLKTEVAE